MTMKYTETVFPVNSHYTILDVPPDGPLRDYASMEFGKNVRRYRKAKNWNQWDLAERMEVSQPTIQRWEAGSRDPSHTDLERLALALGVKVADLFREGEADPIPTSEELSRMIQRAMNEMPVGVTYADYPNAVSSSLRGQLEQYQAGGGFRAIEDEASAPGKGAPPRRPTKQSSPAARRTQ